MKKKFWLLFIPCLISAPRFPYNLSKLLFGSFVSCTCRNIYLEVWKETALQTPDAGKWPVTWSHAWHCNPLWHASLDFHQSMQIKLLAPCWCQARSCVGLSQVVTDGDYHVWSDQLIKHSRPAVTTSGIQVILSSQLSFSDVGWCSGRAIDIQS